MSKRIDFSHQGGFPLHQGVLEFMQSGYSDAIRGLANMAGSMIIVSGMLETGNNVSAGWIVKDGELIPFLAGAKQTTFIVEEISSSARFLDGVDKTVFFTKQARFGSGVEQFQYADLKRISSNSFLLDADTFATSRALRRLAELSLYETNIIVSGCEVSNINGTNQTCTIAAGKVILGEQYFNTAEYIGPFPVWLNASGTFVNNDPGGLNIKFDPHTSQRKADVLRRGVYSTGDLILRKVITDRFDLVTGLGKWEWLGWKLCEELKGSVPVGLWFGEDGPTDVYDPNYRTILTPGGKKQHTLTQGQLPSYNLQTETIGDNGWPREASDRNNNSGTEYLLAPQATNKRNRKLNVPSGGGNQPFDIRQKWTVIAYLERL